jgi:hypothetical protein
MVTFVAAAALITLPACSSGSAKPASKPSSTGSAALPSATPLDPPTQRPITGPLVRHGFKIGLDPNVGWYPIGAGALVLTDLYHPHAAEVSIDYPQITNGSMDATLDQYTSQFDGVERLTPALTLQSQPTGPSRVTVASLQQPHLLLQARSFLRNHGVPTIAILAAEDRDSDGHPDGRALSILAYVKPGDTSGRQEYMAYLLARDLQLT